LPSWGGFLIAELIDKIDVFFSHKAVRCVTGDVLKRLHHLSDLLYEADTKLFRKMMNNAHCIHQLLLLQKFYL